MTRVQRLKTASVFVGAIVGAGFATGREIILFFGNGGFLAPLATGIAMGFCSSLFLYVGRIAARLKKKGVFCGTFFNVCKFAFFAVVGICLLLTLTTMTGGMQSLFGDTAGGRITGFALAALCVGTSSFGAKAVSRINLALVPLLFALLAFLFAKSSKQIFALPFDLSSSVGYLSMNMLLGGCLAVKDGEKATTSDMLRIGALCAAVLGLMTFFVYCVASDYPGSDMPVYSLCAAHGLGALGALAVGIAVLTTLAGAAKSLGDAMYAVVPSRAGVTAALLLLTLASYGWDFAGAVALFYPFIAAVASGVFALTFAVFAGYSLFARAAGAARKRKKPPVEDGL